MVTVALPDLQSDFGVGPDELAWVLTAYIVAFAAATVLYGRVADMVGTKRVYVVGLIIFAVASFAIAFAPNFWTLVGLRALQGFGGTAVPSLSMATIVRTIPAEERGPAMGAVIVAVGVGFGVGPLLGGGLTDLGGWQLPFIATGAAAVLLIPLALKLIPGLDGEAGQRLDIPGLIALAVAISTLTIALNRLPRDPADTLGLVCAAVCLPAFGVLSLALRYSAQPVISPTVLRNVRFVGQATIGLASQGAHFGTVYLLPLLFAGHHDMSVTRMGLHLLPGAALIGIFGMLGGWLVRAVGTRPLIIAGCLVMLAGAVMLQAGGVGGDPVVVAGFYGVLAAGFGMVNASVANAATAELRPSLAGVGVGVFNLMFFVGGAISTAMGGAILRAREGNTESVFPYVPSGDTAPFSDALGIVVFMAMLATVLALTVSRGHHTNEADLAVPATPGS